MKKQSVRHFVKQLLLLIAPRKAGAWFGARQRRHIKRFEQRMGLPEMTASFTEEHGRSVLGGPFVGMAYVAQARGSALMPKLLGSYESELHEMTGRIVGADYTTVVDIGCAEGYYAVGLATRMPSTQVFAYNTDPEARKLCKEMARLNAVENRVTVSGTCQIQELNTVLTGRSFTICDCEGFEGEILQPDLIPAMARAEVLVELHDHIQPGVTPLVLHRFQKTHSATMITATARDAACYPQLRFSTPRNRRLAVSEFRPTSQQWAFLRAGARSPGGAGVGGGEA